MKWRRKSPHAERPAIGVEPMEPRILLSADALGVDAGLVDPAADGLPAWDLEAAADWTKVLGSEDPPVTSAPEPAAAEPVEIVFLDAGVEDGERLLGDLTTGGEHRITQVYILDEGTDGVAQITQILGQQQQSVDAIHILSHGSAGQVQLGSATLSTGNLDGYAGQLNDWGSAFAETGDILIYGCDLAADEQGQALVAAIGGLTGADVAASVDRTGHATLGGDWELEFSTGEIETDVAFSEGLHQDWEQVLDVAVDATSKGTTPSGALSDAVTHMTTGTDRLMLVGISFGQDNRSAQESVDSVTYNGKDLTLVGAQGNADTKKSRVEIWALVAPDIGEHEVVVEYSDNKHKGATIGVMTFTGVDQASPLGSFGSDEGDSSSPSAIIPSAPGELVFGVVALDDSNNYNLVPDAGQTETWDLHRDNANGAGSITSGAASVEVGWTPSPNTSAKWVVGGVSIRPLEAITPGETVVVTTSADTVDGATGSITDLLSAPGADGKISLREAILATNASSGQDTIAFDIPTDDVRHFYYRDDGVSGQVSLGQVTVTTAATDGALVNPDPDFATSWYRISPGSALPVISDYLIIDGSTQPGYAGTPLIEIDGSGAPLGVDGLEITAGNSTVRGLVINGFDAAGIYLPTRGDNLVVGNHIGVDPSGLIDKGNAEDGVSIHSSDNVIGGSGSSDRNVISGNDANGVIITNAAAGNRILGNFIGLGADGSTALGNAADGIKIEDRSDGNTIGGSNIGEGNVISANSRDGIDIDRGDDNEVRGNIIGLDSAGLAVRGNGDAGIELRDGADFNVIGGADAADRNLISGNGYSGISVIGDNTNDNRIIGNWIGLNAVEAVVPAASFGVVVWDGPYRNQIGGAGEGEGNRIAGANKGVLIDANQTDSLNNPILRNEIFANVSMAIDLNHDGVNTNDIGDGDPGPNDLLNHPVIRSLTQTGPNLDIDFELDVPAGDYRVEFFENPTGLSPSGHGGGEVYLGAVSVFHPGGGSATFNETLNSVTSAARGTVTATVTEDLGGGVYGSTSEFSAQIGQLAPSLNGANDLSPIDEDQTDNPGTRVSDLITGRFDDPNTTDSAGIAVVAVDDANGTWEYSTNGGTSWSAFGSVDATSARLLAADAVTLVRFVPDPDWYGTVTDGITFHAWDQTSGHGNGDVADISSAVASVRDEFNSVDYSNNDGSEDWNGPWVEYSDYSGPGGGEIQIVGGALRIDNQDGDGFFGSDPKERISRAVDLGGTDAATLSFDFEKLGDLESSDEVRVQISPDGGDAWVTLETFADDLERSGSRSYDISDYATNDTEIRFIIKNSFGGFGESFEVDNVAISYPAQSTGGSTAFSGLSAASSVDVLPVNDAPTFTAFLGVVDTTTAGTEVEISFGDLAVWGDEADSDGTVDAFVVKSVSNGTLKIGTTPWVAGTNDTINASTSAYWTPAITGTINAFEVVAKDNEGAESPDKVQVAVEVIAGGNTSPQLSGGPYALPDTTEDAISTGAQISTILAGLTVSDGDDDVLGLAIEGATGNGSWQYSTDSTDGIDGGWTDFGPVSNNAALLLSTDSWVRYKPDFFNGESVAVTFRAWDGTAGSPSTGAAQSYANPAGGGDGTAYSEGLAQATLTVTDVDDVPVIAGDVTGSVTEDASTPTLSVSGDLDAVNGDLGEELFEAETLTGLYGSLTVTAEGGWTFDANNSQTAIQQLALSDTLTEDFIVTNADGVTKQTVRITIHGVDDVPTITGDTGGVVVEDATTPTLSVSGDLTATGGDLGEDLFNAETLNGIYGDLTIDADGVWSYAADNSQTAIQALGQGDSLTETFVVTNADDATQTTITITIDGVNEAPTLAGGLTFPATNEKTPGVPVQVKDLLAAPGITVGDDDGNTLGIAVLSTDGNGTWAYSIDGTDGWTDFGGLGVGSALLLSDGTWIRYVPDGATPETAELTFRAWDQTAGQESQEASPQYGDASAPGGASAFSVGTAVGSILVTPVNDEPTLSASAGPVTFTEGGSPVGLFSATAIDPIEPGQDLTGLSLIVANLADGSAERLELDGAVIELTDGTSGLTGSGIAYSVDVSGATATVVLGKTADASTWEAIVNGLRYAHASQDPTPGDRVVTLISLTDAGANTAPNDNVNDSLNVAATVTVVDENDAPTDIALSNNSVVQSAGVNATLGTLSATDAEADDTHSFLLAAGPGDTDNAAFTIVGDELRAKDAGALAAGSYSVRIQADDGKDGTFEEVFALTVTDDIAPALPVDANPELNNVAEGAAVDSNTGLTVQSTDSPTSTVLYTLTDDAGGRFKIDATTGTVSVADGSPLDYESATSHTIIVRATDAAGNAVTRDFTIDVSNVAPSAQDDSASTGENTALAIAAVDGVLGNDSDPNGFNGEAVVAAVNGAAGNIDSAVTGSAGGRFTLQADGSFDFDPGSDFDDLRSSQARDTEVTYTLSDGTDTATATLTVRVNGADDVPVITGDVAGSVTEDDAATLTVSGDLDATGGDTGEQLFNAGTLTGAYGSLSVTAAGEWIYTADNGQAVIQALGPGETLTDNFTVFNADDVTRQVIRITIAGVNDVPVVASVDLGSLAEDGSRLITQTELLAGSADIDDNTLYATGLTVTGGSGALTANGDGTWTFQASPDWSGAVSLGFQVDDGSDTIANTASLTIDPVNDAPTFGNNRMALDPGETVVLSPSMLSAGDADNADSGLQFTVSGVTGGQFERVSAPGVAITGFSQAEVAAGDIVFVDDGDAVLPSYQASVSDGEVTVGPFAALVSAKPATAVVIDEPAVTPDPEPAPIPDPPSDATEPEADSEPATLAEEETFEEAVEEAIVDLPPDDLTGSVGSGLDDVFIEPTLPDFDGNSSPRTSVVKVFLRGLLMPPGAVATAVADLTSPDFFVDQTAAAVRAVLQSDSFNDRMDAMREGIEQATTVHQAVVGSSVTVTTGLSVGYVAWLVRGGVLLSTALSSLPAWQFVDPLPVLSRTRNDDDEAHDESLQNIITEESKRAERRSEASRLKAEEGEAAPSESLSD